MATTSLGRLTLDLVTRITGFVEPLSQAERQARQSSQNMADSLSVANVAVMALGAAAAAVSVGGLAAFANQTIQAGSDIKRFAELANTSVKEFQFYSKGAETAGISMESFADKMKDMQDRIGDFQQSGGGPLADFFENIAPLVGVTIQQFQKLSGPQALQLFHDSLKKASVSENDLKFYMESIISDSSLLLPLLKNGGEGFDRWGQAAERAGAILSDDMVENLAIAKENLQLLDLQWQGLQANLVNNTIPIVQAVADNMDTIKSVGGALAAVIATKLTVSVFLSAKAFTLATIESARYQIALAAMAARAGGATTSIIALRGALAFLGGPAGLAMLAVQGAAAAAAFLYMKNSSEQLKPSLESQGLSIQELTAKYEKLTESAKRNQLRIEQTKFSDLSKQYNDAKSDLIGLVIAMGRFDGSSREAVKQANQLVMQYKQGGISAEELALKINSLNGVSQESKAKIDEQAIAVNNAKAEMQSQKGVVGALESASKRLAKTNDEVTNSVNRQNQAWQSLTKKQRDVITDLKQQSLREKYIQLNMKNQGWSRDQAEFIADKRQEAGIAYTEKAPQAFLQAAAAGYKLQEQTKQREESEKKIEQAMQKQLDHKKKMTDMVGASALSGLRIKSGEAFAGGKVKGYTAEFAQLTQQALGSSLNRFTAFNDLYHKGTNSKHATGNAFDFTVRNAKEATQAVQTLQQMAAKYGFTIKAINEYANPSARSTGGHVHVSVLGYKGKEELLSDAKAEVSIVRESLNEAEELRKQMLEREKGIHENYLSEEEQITYDHIQKLKEIQEVFPKNDPRLAQYTALQTTAYQKELAIFNENKSFKSIEEKKQLLEVQKNWISAGEYAQRYYALLREEILNTSSYSPEVKDLMIKKSYQDQGVEENAEREATWDQYKNRFGLNDSPYQQDIDLLAEAKSKMLITEEEYQQQRLGLQHAYGSEYASSFASLMMGLVDESSSAYSILGGIQKASALYSVAMSNKVAIAKAWESAAFPYNLPAVAMATVETGLLQAAVQALTPMSGYAEGGFTGYGGKYDVAGVVHKGEGVLNQEEIAAIGGPSGFYALRAAIKNGYAEGGFVDSPKMLNVTPKIQSYVDEAKAMQQQQSSLHQTINNIVNWDDVPEVMAGHQGQKVTLNVISKNRTQIRKLLGV